MGLRIIRKTQALVMDVSELERLDVLRSQTAGLFAAKGDGEGQKNFLDKFARLRQGIGTEQDVLAMAGRVRQTIVRNFQLHGERYEDQLHSHVDIVSLIELL